MSTGSASIISPMITKQIIDNIKKEDDGCILFISSSASANTTTTSNHNNNNNNGSPSSDTKESCSSRSSCSSLTTTSVNGHNYMGVGNKATPSNVNNSAITIQRGDRLNAVTTTANRSTTATMKRIDFTISRQQSSSSNNIDLFKTSASLDGSPSSSPSLSFHESHPQDMFCSSTVSGDCGSNAVVDTNDLGKARDSSPKRLCLVCGDTASGFHYGVASCEACKAFFKRTIQGNIEYTCPATNECEINKRRRKACQACRFQKCLRMGMLKEGVRLDRVRGGRQKYRRTSEAPYQQQNYNNKKTNVEDNRMVAALINCEPEPISSVTLQISSPSSSSTSSSLSSVSSSQYKNLCILSDLVDKELVATIGWAKQIPGFSDLILNDQMRLLQSTWAEILALSLAFRSHQFSSPPNTPAGLSPNNASSTTNPIFNKLVYTNDFIMDDQQANNCNAEEYFAHMIYLIKRLHHMKIHREEYLLMKAILLTNADIQLENYERVAKLRETLFHALQDVVSILHPGNAVTHLCQLMMCLPLIRQLDGFTRRYWLNILQEGSVTMNKLFVEMLESNVSY